MLEKTALRIDWFLTNGSIVLFAVLGVVFGSSMAVNVFKFLAWFFYGLYIIGIFSEAAQEARRRKGPSMPPRLGLLIDMSVAVLLAAYGWFGYATLVAIGGMCCAYAYLSESEAKENV